jgi:formate hydrogenlyase subunit 3/multisubunit Na+/H+ antiporter MnhD subunit
MMEVSSQLPLAICVVPAALAVVAYPLGRAARPIGPVVNLLGAAVVTALAVPMALGAMKGEVYVSLARELRVDSLSALMVLVIGGVSLAAAIYAFPYMRLQELVERVRGEAGEEVIDRRLAAFYALSLAFLATMLWACTTNNIIMLYVSVEASTLASGLLVAFYWDRRSLEASYKYLMLLTVGIAFALFGCVLLYASAVQHIPGQAGLRAMLISDLNEIGGEIPRTKAGIAPFHPWLPDAHAEAPSPVSALLSGVMIKMAIYALARTLGIFFPLAQYHPVAMFVIVLSAFTMLLGGVMCLAQDDLKRLLAYSSVGQMGYIAMGLGLVGIGYGQTAGYLGSYGSLFHLVNHALSKSLLFLAVGTVIYATAGRRRTTELSGLARRMPATAVCFFVGAFAISGMPPFNGFWSKLTLYFAAADAELWWAFGIAIAASLLTLVAFIRVGYQVFWSEGDEPRDELGEQGEAPGAMLVSMGALAACCVILGLFPSLVYPLLDPAARVLASIF